MREEITELLRCPKCKGDIEIAKRVEIIKLKGVAFLSSGLIGCKQCAALYPVIDRIPRILKDEELMPSEKQFIQKYRDSSLKEPKISVKTEIPDKEKRKILEKLIKKKLLKDERYKAVIAEMDSENPQFKSEESRNIKKIVEQEIHYRVNDTENKDRFVNTVLPYMKEKPEVIADIGGGQGGTISCFAKYFKPMLTILIDYDISLAEMALVRDPMVNIIRADGADLPFKNRSIDLLVTTSVLEHIKSWEKAADEIARISKEAFINFGPNKWFLYDWGHVNAPFVTVLPASVGAGVAYFFHKFIFKTGYSYKRLKEEIELTYFIPRYKVMRILKRYGNVNNLFYEFLRNSLESGSAYQAARVKLFLKDHPLFLKISSKLLVLFGLEPEFYLYFKNNRANL